MLTIGDSIPAQLVRKTTQKGFTFNIMSIGPNELNKTTLLSALFGRNLDLSYGETTTTRQPAGDFDPTIKKTNKADAPKDGSNPPIYISTKTFEIEEKRVRLKLTVAESENYGDAMVLHDTYQPLVKYIDEQFADYYKRESSYNRRHIYDRMIHCLFFFISPYGHGLTKLDLQFLQAVHSRVNIIPIIAKAEVLTLEERLAFKRRVVEDLKKNHIKVYQLGSPDMDDPEEFKRAYKDIQDAMPFAISSMTLSSECLPTERCLDWGVIDPYNLDHSDFLLLKTMLHMQIPDLCEITHDVFYEDYRLEMMQKEPCGVSFGQALLRRAPKSVERI